MKHVFVAAFITTALANLNSIEYQWRNLTIQEKVSQCEDFKNESGEFISGTPNICLIGLRGTFFTGQMVMFSSASNYGCWCDIGNDLRRGSNGDPVNELDTACRDLHHNYNCITIEDPTCNPRTLDAGAGEYQVPINALSPLSTVEDACAASNQIDSCAYNTCVSEAYFLRQTVTPIYAGDQTWTEMWSDEEFIHTPDGQFDYADRCGVEPTGVAGGFSFDLQQNPCGPGGCSVNINRKQCCGDFPRKTAYNPIIAMCCSDVVSSIGTC